MSSASFVKTPSFGSATPGLPALAYIVGSFPAASQQFVVREIRGLIDAGVPIQVFALGRERGSTVEPIDEPW